eukprot:1154875-Pelagomonas_calceolata.AAC.2
MLPNSPDSMKKIADLVNCLKKPFAYKLLFMCISLPFLLPLLISSVEEGSRVNSSHSVHNGIDK